MRFLGYMDSSLVGFYVAFLVKCSFMVGLRGLYGSFALLSRLYVFGFLSIRVFRWCFYLGA